MISEKLLLQFTFFVFFFFRFLITPQPLKCYTTDAVENTAIVRKMATTNIWHCTLQNFNRRHCRHRLRSSLVATDNNSVSDNIILKIIAKKKERKLEKHLGEKVEELSTLKKSFFFSFISKLLHTLNSDVKKKKK